MTKFTRLLAVAAVMIVGVLLVGCGTERPASSAPTTAPPLTSESPVGDVSTTFSNSVPEAPWWDKVNTSPESRAPAALTWTLSGDILFDSGSATLSPSGLSQLSGIVMVAEHHCDPTITVLGYTDSIPYPTFPGGNQGLSAARATAVAKIFDEAAITGERVRAVGEGGSNPVGDNTTANGRQANRRVVIELAAPAAGELGANGGLHHRSSHQQCFQDTDEARSS